MCFWLLHGSSDSSPTFACFIVLTWGCVEKITSVWTCGFQMLLGKHSSMGCCTKDFWPELRLEILHIDELPKAFPHSLETVTGQECHADWDILEPQVGTVAEFLVHKQGVLGSGSTWCNRHAIWMKMLRIEVQCARRPGREIWFPPERWVLMALVVVNYPFIKVPIVSLIAVSCYVYCNCFKHI